MDFLVCKKACGGIQQTSQTDSVLTDVEDVSGAISMAREIAAGTREGVMVALFTQDAKPVCGWKVIEEGELKSEDIEVIHDIFYNVSPEDFKLAKRQFEIRKIRFQTTTS